MLIQSVIKEYLYGFSCILSHRWSSLSIILLWSVILKICSDPSLIYILKPLSITSTAHTNCKEIGSHHSVNNCILISDKKWPSIIGLLMRWYCCSIRKLGWDNLWIDFLVMSLNDKIQYFSLNSLYKITNSLGNTIKNLYKIGNQK